MLDYSRATDFLAEMAGQALQDAAPAPQGLTELLATAGLDPSTLAGMSGGEVMALMSDHGIYPMQFAPKSSRTSSEVWKAAAVMARASCRAPSSRAATAERARVKSRKQAYEDLRHG
jgi:hypothetical protein